MCTGHVVDTDVARSSPVGHPYGRPTFGCFGPERLQNPHPVEAGRERLVGREAATVVDGSYPAHHPTCGD